MFNHLEKFDGHTLIDVAREGVDLGDTEEEKQEVQLPPAHIMRSCCLCPAKASSATALASPAYQPGMAGPNACSTLPLQSQSRQLSGKQHQWGKPVRKHSSWQPAIQASSLLELFARWALHSVNCRPSAKQSRYAMPLCTVTATPTAQVHPMLRPLLHEQPCRLRTPAARLLASWLRYRMCWDMRPCTSSALRQRSFLFLHPVSFLPSLCNHPRAAARCNCPLQAQAAEADLKPLMELMKEALGERVEKVVASQRLADSPCALATSKFGWSAYQERIMRSQVLPSVLIAV